jgi:DNA-binding Lrp family transcriptional regulator
MAKKLETIDVKILECLDKYGPRNLSLIAKNLGMPRDTVEYRIERMSTFFSLHSTAVVYTSKIGMKIAFLFVNSSPSFKETLIECVKANDYWCYLSQIYGNKEGVLAFYTVPLEHARNFKEFFHFLKSLKFVKNSQLYWITGFPTINPTMKWFDPNYGRWILKWKEWINEIALLEPEMPPTLIEPVDYSIEADYTDIFILSRLEINGRVSLKEIAQKLGLTPPAVSYHYNRHVLKRGLIKKWSIAIRRFEADCDRFFFFFRFDSKEKMARFAMSVRDKPFLYGIGRICGENSLITHLGLPPREFRMFLQSLSQLIKKGFLQSYDYLLEDYTKALGRTIPYRYFKNGEWEYNHKGHIRELMKISTKVQKMIELPVAGQK